MFLNHLHRLRCNIYRIHGASIEGNFIQEYVASARTELDKTYQLAAYWTNSRWFSHSIQLELFVLQFQFTINMFNNIDALTSENSEQRATTTKTIVKRISGNEIHFSLQLLSEFNVCRKYIFTSLNEQTRLVCDVNCKCICYSEKLKYVCSIQKLKFYSVFCQRTWRNDRTTNSRIVKTISVPTLTFSQLLLLLMTILDWIKILAIAR